MSDTSSGAPETFEVTRSSRDLEELRARLAHWLRDREPDRPVPVVPQLTATSANGMSSETVLFEAVWGDDGGAVVDHLVARIAPDPQDVPVFRSYDMTRQYDVIRLVGELTGVPVPRVPWNEADPSVLGMPFFVMERVDGEVPPDVMPYTFGDNWLYDASPEEQRRLQDRSLEVLAELHSLSGEDDRFAFLAFDEPGDDALRRHVNNTRSWYEWAVADAGMRSPLTERGLAWLEDHWPADPGEAVVSWGDARIGNAMYRDFSPVAVLDWEMAGLGPRELDLAWMVFAHMVFEDIASVFELPGMPHFLRLEDAASTYERLTGHTPRDLEFHLVYCAVQWGVVFLRTSARQLHFGEIEEPEHVDELLRHAALFERLLA